MASFMMALHPMLTPGERAVQRVMAEESGWLEGGVSIGIAVLQDRHEGPNDLRADATEALREAYQTGACTILE